MTSDAERNLLSAILSPLGSDFPDIDIVPDDYADPRHGDIHTAAQRVAQSDVPINPVTVADQLGADVNRLPGGESYLHELVSLMAVPAQATYFAEIVAKEATRRRLKQAAAWLMEHADDDDPAATHDQIRAQLESLQTVGTTTTVKRLGDTLPHTLELLAQEDGGYTPTGWSDLNKFIGGWRPGNLYVVGARPGTGKSIIGAQAAWDVAKTGSAVLLSSMEMTDDEVNTRLLAMNGPVHMDMLTRRRITDIGWERLAGTQGRLMDAPLFYDDRSEQRVSEIRSAARWIQRRQPLGLVVVDYVQLIKPPTELARATKREQVMHSARSLKAIAKDLAVPVLALAQVNRASTSRTDKRPILADLAETDALGQDANVVLLLHREDEADDLEVIVEKNRHGQRGVLNLAWQAHFARVMNSNDPFGRNAS